MNYLYKMLTGHQFEDETFIQATEVAFEYKPHKM